MLKNISLAPIFTFFYAISLQVCFGEIETLQGTYQSKELDWRISGNYVLWQVAVEGLDMAADNAYIDYFPPPHRGRAYGVSFPLKSGFQIALGTLVEGLNGGALELIYTWLSPLCKENISQDPVVQTFPFYSVKPSEKLPNSHVFVVDHLAMFQSYYNLLDLFIGRENQIAPAFTLDLFTGLRGTWQKQLWNTNLLMFTENPVFSNYLYNYKQDFQGAGPISGIRLKCFPQKNSRFFENLILFGKTAVSGIFGNIRVDSLLSTQTSLTNLVYSSNRKTIFTIVPVWDLSIGLSLEKKYKTGLNTPYTVFFQALWETQCWMGFNKMQASVIYFSTPYSMTVQGLTAGIGVLF